MAIFYSISLFHTQYPLTFVHVHVHCMHHIHCTCTLVQNCSLTFLARTVTNYLFALFLTVGMIYTFFKTNRSDPGYIAKPPLPKEEYKVQTICVMYTLNCILTMYVLICTCTLYNVNMPEIL